MAPLSTKDPEPVFVSAAPETVPPMVNGVAASTAIVAVGLVKASFVLIVVAAAAASTVMAEAPAIVSVLFPVLCTMTDDKLSWPFTLRLLMLISAPRTILFWLA